jgi:hypothetical protein
MRGAGVMHAETQGACVCHTPKQGAVDGGPPRRALSRRSGCFIASLRVRSPSAVMRHGGCEWRGRYKVSSNPDSPLSGF